VGVGVHAGVLGADVVAAACAAPQSKLDEKDVLKPVNITELPDASLLGGNAIDAFRKFWSPDNLATMFSK